MIYFYCLFFRIQLREQVINQLREEIKAELREQVVNELKEVKEELANEIAIISNPKKVLNIAI